MATKIFLPRLGESIEEASIIRYTKEVGEKLERGDVIAELETAKAMMELENPVKGVLLAVFPEVGETIPRGTLVAIVGKEGEDWEAMLAEDETEEEDGTGITSKSQQIKPETKSRTSKTDLSSKRINISPNARRLAESKGVDLKDLTEAYPGKRITGDDVKSFIENAAEEEASEVPVEALKLNTVQLLTAKRMAESGRDIPQFSVSVVVDVNSLLNKLRESLISKNHPTVTALLVQAVAKALAEHPRLNAFFHQETVYQYQDINLAIAINTPYGLVAPVIHQADHLTIEVIAEQLSTLKQKSKDKKLSSGEIEGGTFTISNLGMMGIRTFIPMVTPKQAGILGVGEVYLTTVIDDNGNLSQKSEMTLTLTADHRVVGGAECATFLNRLKSIIENE